MNNANDSRQQSGLISRRGLSPILATLSALACLSGTAAHGQGLQGQYYQSATPSAPGVPGAFSRIDGPIAFTWFGDAPDGTPIFADDVYSERWTGWVHVDQGGTWTFSTYSNDGTRLWVNDVLLIDEWAAHPSQTDSASMVLANPGWYPIRLEHFNAGGIGAMHLYYAGPGHPHALIAAAELSPTAPPSTTTPTVDAGSDAYVTPAHPTAQLSGSATAPDGIQSVQWTQVSGPPATLTGATTLQPTLTTTTSGQYVLRLQATSTSGGVAHDEASVFQVASAGGAVSGVLRKWHTTTVSFEHPTFQTELDSDNPFLNYRLQVTFTHPASGTSYVVPGYFAANGDAAHTGSSGGTVWRAHLTPDHAGDWQYVASFRTGPEVALNLDPSAGTPVSFDGSAGTFYVEAADPNAPGFRAKGALRYVDDHHLRFAENQEYFLKGGADSPENLLGYYEFDGTYDAGGWQNGLNTGGYGDGLHHFDAHLADYAGLGGGPTWTGGAGKRLIGALNYLSSMGVNSSYFLTYNVDGGDGGEVWPWIAPASKLRMDVSKLAQWSLVFEHMMDRGIALHVLTQETENDQGLDGGWLGVQRKLYYRELIARFGHSLALTWNLGEENTNTDAQRRDFANYIRALDAYEHPITVHTYGSEIDAVYNPLLGFENFNGPSLQMLPWDIHFKTKSMIDESASMGHPWVVNYDEQGTADNGVVPDAVDFWHSEIRRDALWGNLMAGGGGVEYYFGYSHPHDDLDCEDWRSRHHMWQLTDLALDFFQSHLPFWDMRHGDHLTPDPEDYVLRKDGTHYVVYRPWGGGTNLDLGSSTDTYKVEWFNPRDGGPLLSGSVATITGPGPEWIGEPPWGTGIDWVALVRRVTNSAPLITAAGSDPAVFTPNTDFAFQVHVVDPDGWDDIERVEVYFWRPDLAFLGGFPLESVGGDLYTAFFPDLGPIMSGSWTYWAVAIDQAGARHSQIGAVTVQ